MLRPDGRGVLSVGALVEDEQARAKTGDPPGFWEWTQARAREDLTRAGFADPEIRHIKACEARYRRLFLKAAGFDTIRVAIAHPAADATATQCAGAAADRPQRAAAPVAWVPQAEAGERTHRLEPERPAGRAAVAVDVYELRSADAEVPSPSAMRAGSAAR